MYPKVIALLIDYTAIVGNLDIGIGPGSEDKSAGGDADCCVKPESAEPRMDGVRIWRAFARNARAAHVSGALRKEIG